MIINESTRSSKKIVAGDGTIVSTRSYVKKVLDKACELWFSDGKKLGRPSDKRKLMNKMIDNNIPLTGYYDGIWAVEFYTPLTYDEAIKKYGQ